MCCNINKKNDKSKDKKDKKDEKDNKSNKPEVQNNKTKEEELNHNDRQHTMTSQTKSRSAPVSQNLISNSQTDQRAKSHAEKHIERWLLKSKQDQVINEYL